jgi:hypothetical protein
MSIVSTVEELSGAWAAVPWHAPLAPIVGVDAAIRLAGMGLYTAGDLDALLLGYGEADLPFGMRERARLIRTFTAWCLRHLHSKLLESRMSTTISSTAARAAVEFLHKLHDLEARLTEAESAAAEAADQLRRCAPRMKDDPALKRIRKDVNQKRRAAADGLAELRRLIREDRENVAGTIFDVRTNGVAEPVPAAVVPGYPDTPAAAKPYAWDVVVKMRNCEEKTITLVAPTEKQARRKAERQRGVLEVVSLSPLTEEQYRRTHGSRKAR